MLIPFIKFSNQNSVIRPLFLKLGPFVKQVLFLSFFTNLLALAPTWYMLEVYGRVLNSKNYNTLFFLSLLVIFILIILELLEFLRSKIMLNASIYFANQLNIKTFLNVFQIKLKQNSDMTSQAFSDLKAIQAVIASPVFLALIDIPFSFVTLGLVFMINPMMGWFAVLGAIIIGLLSFLNYVKIKPHIALASKEMSQAQKYASDSIRNAQVIDSLGMLPFVRRKWLDMQKKYISFQALASDVAGMGSALSKFIQTLQGSLLLGLGCWLTLSGIISIDGSMMMIGSILGARVLLPYIKLTTNLRLIGTTQESIFRLDNLLAAIPEPIDRMKLPDPLGAIAVESVFVTAPGGQLPILKNMTFALPAGKSLGVIGPSASGKSTLAKLITGIWPALNGKVRLDNADINHWDKNQLGPFIGYLPQDIELFGGSIAENIARFGVFSMDEVIKAAQIAGLSDLIESLDDGYETQIGDDGAFLSGGQRQRIGLARAVYGAPKLIVLDEPNSSLDAAGDFALLNMIETLKSFNSTLIVITHKPQILENLDYVMVLGDGQIKAYGPTTEIFKKIEVNPNAKSPR